MNDRMGVMKETPKTHYIQGFSEFFFRVNPAKAGTYFIDFLERMDMLRLLVIVLSVEIPLHKPVPKYEKDQLVDAMISDMGYIRILRKPFVIPWDTSLVEFDHVIDIRFTVF